MTAGKIFLCYRREDSAGHAGRIYDRLNQRFPGRIFMDVAGIGAGTRWAEVIEETLGSCEVVVILIGRRWLEPGPAGTRRIDDPEDPLRAEIATALRLKLKIVPLLLADAAVPQPDDLPEDVAPIVDWQALRIDDDDFDHDSSRLIKALERQLKDEGTDLHHESAHARHSEIRRLLANAESCIARADWITAAQTLQAVLSLDRTHAEAAARLRFVHQQSARPYTPAPSPPSPPKRRTGLWAALGLLGILGVIGVVVAVVLIGQMVSERGEMPYGPQPSDEPVAPDDIARIDPPEGETETAAPDALQMAGDYVLTSYAQQGVMIPLSGRMRLQQIDEGRFQFATFVTNPALGATFQYHGFFEGQRTNWTTTTLQTNDPTAVPGAIPTQVRFDGFALELQNSYGQYAVWQKTTD